MPRYRVFERVRLARVNVSEHDRLADKARDLGAPAFCENWSTGALKRWIERNADGT